MAKRTLDFSKLVKEHDEFTDLDGTVHQFVAEGDLGANGMAKITRLKKTLESAFAVLAEDDNNVEQAQIVDESIRAIVHLALPTLSEVRLKEISTGQCYQIMRWWTDANAEATPTGEATADQKS